MKGAYKKLVAVIDTRPDVLMTVYGRGRNRTLAIGKSPWPWDKILAKTHYSIATQDQAAVEVIKQMQLDGEPPPWLTATLT